MSLEEISLDESWLISTDAPSKGDAALFVRFRLHPKKDDKATAEAGRPIYKNVEYISISAAGDKFNQVDRPATRSDKLRFRRQYKAWKDHQEDSADGTPLSKWPLIDAAQVEELKHFNIHTVEQLALMPDGNIPNVGNISHLKKHAVDYLALARGSAPTVQLRNELEKRDALMAAMQRQMDEQARLIQQLSAPQAHEDSPEVKPRRGRPAKEVAAQE